MALQPLLCSTAYLARLPCGPWTSWVRPCHKDGKQTSCCMRLQYRDGAQSFLITQFGLSCFVWEEGQYQAHTFNFYLFPLPMLPGPSRRFMCDVSNQP